MKKFYFWFLLIYPLIFCNSRMTNDLPGFDKFAIFSFLPKEIRYVEIILIIIAFIFALLNKNSLYRYSTLPSIFIFLFLAFIGGVINFIPFQDTLQVTYTFILPFLIIYTIISFDYNLNDLKKAINFYNIILLVSIPIMLYEFLFFRRLPVVNPADIANGLFRDSNVSANYFFILMFYNIAFFLKRGEKKYVIFSSAAFFLAFIGFNEKSTIFSVVLLLFFFVKTGKLRIKNLVIIVPLVILLIFINTIAKKDDANPLLRLNLLEDVELTKIGPVKSYLNTFEIWTESIGYVIFGSGAGTYSNPIIFSKWERGKISELTRKYNYDIMLASESKDSNINSAIDWTVNIFTGLLVELGFIAAMIIVLLYRKLLKDLINIYRKKDKSDYIALATILGLNLLLLNSLISNVSNIDEMVLIVPISFISAILIKNNYAN